MRHTFTAAIFVLLTLGHIHLIATVLLGFGSEPWIILAGHVVCLCIAVAAGLASWQKRSWAWRAVAAYGVAGALLILSLGPALKLPAEQWIGLWFGAAVVLALSGVGAWGLR